MRMGKDIIVTGRVLILGASGRFGRSAAEAFWNAGWRVSILDRSTGDLDAAAQGMDVIVNGWNPPYPDWGAAVPKLTQAVIKAAKSSGATVLLPGNVYVFGETAQPCLDEHAPHRAQNPLGKIRIEMEAAYRAAQIPVILIRAGDFLDTEASGNWFDKVIARPVCKGRLSYPGPVDVPHAWAFLPDLARAAVALCDMRAALPVFADIPFPGYTLTGQELADLCTLAMDQPVKATQMTWLPIQLARPFWPVSKHLLEMKYLWQKPHHLDASKFNSLLPNFVQTDQAEAICMALAPLRETQDRPRPTDAGRHPAPAA